MEPAVQRGRGVRIRERLEARARDVGRQLEGGAVYARERQLVAFVAIAVMGVVLAVPQTRLLVWPSPLVSVECLGLLLAIAFHGPLLVLVSPRLTGGCG